MNQAQAPLKLETSMEPPAVRAPTKLMNRNFYLLWQGQSISSLGSQGFSIGMLFWVKHVTGSATLMGLMMMLSTLPAVLLGPLGGTFADRYPRKKILVLCDFVRGLTVLSLVGALLFFSENYQPILVWIFVVNIFIGIFGTFFNPAIVSAVPDIVPQERVMSANSLTQMSYQLSMFIGQGLGGVLFRVLGAPILFLVNGFTYLFAALSESFIVVPQKIPEKPKTVRNQLNEFKTDTLKGFQYVWTTTGLRNLVIVSAFLNFFTIPVITLMPFYVEDTLQASTDWYGFILAIYGIGALLGYLFAGLIKQSGQSRGKMMVGFIILESIGFGLLGLVRGPVVAMGLAALGGFVGGFVAVNITTIIQIKTPNEIRGRVFGLLSTIAGALSPIGMGLAGVVADLTGKNIPLIYISCGLIMTILSAVISTNREFREFLVYEKSSEPIPGVEGQAIVSD